MSMLLQLSPFHLVTTASEELWPIVGPLLERLPDSTFNAVSSLFDLAALMLIYTMVSWSWLYRAVALVLLGIFKILLRRRTLTCGRLASRTSEAATTTTEQDIVNPNGPKLGIEDIAKTLTRGASPSVEWLNIVLRTFWLNSRAYVRYLILHEIWPKLKEELSETQVANLDIIDLNIGDKCPFISSIECVSRSNNDTVIDLKISYDGNAHVTITYSQRQLSISLPITLQGFSVSNVNLRVVLKHFLEHLPLVGGCQISFLEKPVIDWEAGDVAKMADLPVVNDLIKFAIDHHLMKRFVHPNRFTVPFTLPPSVVEKINAEGLPVEQIEPMLIAMPAPAGILKVTVIKAENLKANSFGFHHYLRSKNLNPFRPRHFACSELLPQRSYSNPYLCVAVGNESFKSSVASATVNPEWNFSCDFPIEHYHKVEVVVDVIDKSLHLTHEDALIARVTEKLVRIKEKEVVEGWYNSHILQGRVNVRFDWTLLTKERPPQTEAGACTMGVLCVVIGTLKSENPVRATCYLELVDGTSVTNWSSLDALAAKSEWPFNEGAVFRVLRCLSNSSLTIKIYDHKKSAYIGERSFAIRRLLSKPLNGEFSFPVAHTDDVFTLSLKTEMLFDSVQP